ncbi:MAG: ABC transporter permease, partial [Planctomycetaceae bacterium]|nr:ABC transporter permease [Planctomycetaceae bacterium]
LDAVSYNSRKEAEDALIKGRVRVVIVIPNDFSSGISSAKTNIQVLPDGSETNTATLAENYILGIVRNYQKRIFQNYTFQGRDRKVTEINVQQRVLFNPELNTRNALVPGSIVLVMAIIGTMLTAMVVSREWERGTMEAMLATPVRTIDMMLGKILTYYLLGICSTAICVLISIFLFGVPFRGSVLALFLVSSVFLGTALMQGYLISTIAKSQFISGQMSLVSAFLPNVFLSGALFEIASMPLFLRGITYMFPGRYYVTSLQTLFMAGDVWTLLLPNMGYMTIIGLCFTVLTFIKTPKRLM